MWVAHHERKLIWGDVRDAMPDILLSIGTGTECSDGDGEYSSRLANARHEEEEPSSAKPKPKSAKSFFPMDMWRMVTDRLGSLMRCSEIWDGFITQNSTTSRQGRLGGHRRLIRINPTMRGKVPDLDEVDQLRNMERSANSYLRQNQPKIREVAHRLIASTFFFEKQKGSVRSMEVGFACTGEYLDEKPINYLVEYLLRYPT